MIILLVYLMMISDETEQRETDDDSEDEDSDEDQTIAKKHPDDFNLQFGKVGIENSSGTQFGNRSEYHGTVNVHNEYKISCNGAPSSDLPFSYIFPNGTTKQLTQNISVLPIEDEDNLDTRELLLSNQVEDDEPCPQHKDDDGVKLRRKRLLCVGAGTAGVVVIAIVIAVYFTVRSKQKQHNLPQNFSRRLVLRGEWGADTPLFKIPEFSYDPIPHVVVCHTGAYPCKIKSDCLFLVQMMQVKLLSSGSADIPYNFLVGGDGYIYEGRGWKEVSAGTPPVDCSAISVAFIGDFMIKKPPKRQLDAFKLILDEGLRTNRLTKPFKMFMQKEVIDTESPGDALIQILTSSPYWTPFTKKDILCN